MEVRNDDAAAEDPEEEEERVTQRHRIVKTEEEATTPKSRFISPMLILSIYNNVKIFQPSHKLQNINLISDTRILTGLEVLRLAMKKSVSRKLP